MKRQLKPSAGLMPLEDVQNILLSSVEPVRGIEKIQLMNAVDRVIVQDIVSPLTIPSAATSTMDGFAFTFGDLPAMRDIQMDISQRIPAGSRSKPLVKGTAARVFTGTELPAGADTVVIQEDCSFDTDKVTIRELPLLGANIRGVGEDLEQGQLVLPAGRRLKPQDIGLLASFGEVDVEVLRSVKVGLFSTGDELVEPGVTLKRGQVYNSNRYTLNTMLTSMGCQVVDCGIVQDDYRVTVEELNKLAQEVDVIITTGGVSEGEEDHVKNAVLENGSLELWKIAMKPGKPFSFGEVRKTPFFGLPGNPVSAFVTFLVLVKDVLKLMQGRGDEFKRRTKITADFEWQASRDRKEFVRVKTVEKPTGTYAQLFSNQGSSVLLSTSWADGLVEIDIGKDVSQNDRLLYLPFD